ncbi:MAG: SAVED domain-containing protein [Xenococcus sp. MO_188.B8]|nr:SAVED domain-containing protein [Xenococcus sp. MO_188.B8]
MSKTSIPAKVKLKLWIKSGGRCQFRGCNEQLYRDDLTQAKMNKAYIAHIVADSPDGVRGDKKLSPKLAKEFSNLMLLCDAHHRLIDNPSHGHIYTVEQLQTYKKEHEDRIEYLTGIDERHKSHLLFFLDNIRHFKPTIDFEDARQSMLPRYPADSHPINLNLTNSPYVDNEPDYFLKKQDEIRRRFDIEIKPKIAYQRINHLSIFALAPIPLLIYFGYKIGDITPSDIYQKHRDSDSWRWQSSNPEFRYIVEKEPLSELNSKSVVLNLSLSGTIQPDEIKKVIQEPYHLYKITIHKPDRNYLKSKDQLELFNLEMRSLLREIRDLHGEDCNIHLFSAIPVSIAVSFGQLLLPKSDPLIFIYDLIDNQTGFRYALSIPSEKD